MDRPKFRVPQHREKKEGIKSFGMVQVVYSIHESFLCPSD